MFNTNIYNSKALDNNCDKPSISGSTSCAAWFKGGSSRCNLHLMLLPSAHALGETKHPTSLGRWNKMKVRFTTLLLGVGRTTLTLQARWFYILWQRFNLFNFYFWKRIDPLPPIVLSSQRHSQQQQISVQCSSQIFGLSHTGQLLSRHSTGLQNWAALIYNWGV